ncbi:Haemolysin XhlA [Caloranaerobacter azorensis DSM 13643]|uniref:Haemolysin XhlA n=1 Tax=Caloranaerobacter azorensis DSM 13643 TaxID=1121264 RepID=A0A1M5VLN9_9FIRM|nr:hemolysin XhlA family protein [Caloranaerobacter azorensis]SHH76145.1 Haemolysin XhlA [Caloranaerobacter azorensis DSM 13643]
MGVCERHEEIMEKLDNHESRIVQLEINDAKMGEKIQNLIEKIESLTAWIKALVMLGATSLIGFFIWYIQSLGRW